MSDDERDDVSGVVIDAVAEAAAGTGTAEDVVMASGAVDDGSHDEAVDDTSRDGVTDDGATAEDVTDEDYLDDDLYDDVADQPVLADEEVEAALEAVLLVVDSPVAEEQLAAAVGRTAAEVRERLLGLAEGFTARRSGIDLREAGGGWRFYTRDVFAPVVERFVLDGTQTRLSRAALETLAVIAYRQPVTRARISAVRGVNVDGVVRTLLARGLIEEEGIDHDTGGILYQTTDLFLERMGLGSIEDLPALGPLLPDVDAIDDE